MYISSSYKTDLFLPKANSEVLVSFINGNPDRPVIVGSLYNQENDMPYPLPNNKPKATSEPIAILNTKRKEIIKAKTKLTINLETKPKLTATIKAKENPNLTAKNRADYLTIP
jgi:uncharacterized protein involved in type VI secretion and phage assembly